MKRQIFISEDIIDLVPAYLEARHKDIPALRAATDKNDFETVALIALKLKGVAASFGFSDLSTIGVALEMAAESRRPAAVLAQVKLMEGYLDSIKIKPEKVA
jgi:HPt (histidine-containing phosphotransfer) domain-containing protein